MPNIDFLPIYWLKARSSVRRFKKRQIGLACARSYVIVVFVHAGQKKIVSIKKISTVEDRWVCVVIDVKTMTVKGNWTSLVQSVLYLPCTRLVQFPLTVVVLTSITTQTQRSKFCQLNQFFFVGLVQRLLPHRSARMQDQFVVFWTA